MGIGFVAIVSFLMVTSYVRSKEYPDLSINVSLRDKVQDYTIDHGAVFIKFSPEKKYRIFEISNLDVGGPTLQDIITVGDLVVKRSDSDTLTITHDGKEYLYIIKGLK